MAKSNQTASRQSAPGSFDALQVRFLSLTSRLEVLKDVLGNPENVPNELGPAAYVLNETTDEIVQLQNDLESWHLAHEHTPKARKVQS